MRKNVIYYAGILGVIATFFVTFMSFSSETIDFQIPFLLIGVLLSLCVIGIGKIITVITKKGDNKEKT